MESLHCNVMYCIGTGAVRHYGADSALSKVWTELTHGWVVTGSSSSH